MAPILAMSSISLLFLGGASARWSEREHLSLSAGQIRNNATLEMPIAQNDGQSSSLSQRKHQRRSVLILKQARTGSTWFCEQANIAGLHISQEAMFKWEHYLPENKTVDDVQDFFTKDARMAWVQQSLVRPMPKNPFAKLDGCNYARQDCAASKKEACATVDDSTCVPPFTNEACSDFNGCFHQWSRQGNCMHEEKEPSLFGMSFSYLGPLGDVDPYSAEYAALLAGVVDKVRKSGVDVTVLTQSSSNVIHWALSLKFHSYKNRQPEDKFKDGWEYNKDFSKFIIKDPEKFFLSKFEKASESLEIGRRVDGGDSHVMFYEDIGRSMIGSIAALLDLSQGKTRRTKTELCNNCQNQHAEAPSKYIENIDEVLNKMKNYPCVVRQLKHENKFDTFLLPYTLDKTGKIGVDFSKDCCVADSSTLIRTIDDYIKSYSSMC